MTRTNRTPIEVMDDATWGMFAEGWRDGTGADADHLKTTADIDASLAVGFTFFTIDPSAHVDSAADTDELATLRAKVAALPWAELADTEDVAAEALPRASAFAVEHLKVAFDEAVLLRAAAKYGKAVAHVAKMSRHLLKAAGATPVELEVSVDETDTPTSPAEHYWVAAELRRLGVAWVSLAPRFVGRFEKGVDYIGDLGGARDGRRRPRGDRPPLRALQAQPALGLRQVQRLPDRRPAREGPGPPEDRRARATSRRCARWRRVDPAIFRAIYAFARERYDTDKASYHVSAELAKAPGARRTCPSASCPACSSTSTPARSCTSPSARC